MNETTPESGTPEVPANNVQPEETVNPMNPTTAPEPTQAKRPRLIIPEQEVAPAQPAPVQPAPVEPAPVQPVPVQLTPAQAPVAPAPMQSPALEPVPIQPNLEQVTPAPAYAAPAPVQTPPAEPAPAPVQPAPVQTAPAEPAPAPIQPAPVQTPPAEPAPAPVQPAPVQLAPVAQAPAQPAPIQLTPAAQAPVQPVPAPQITVPLSGAAQTPPAMAPAAALGTATQPRGIPGQPQPGGVGIGSVAPMKKQGVSNAVKGMIAITLAAGIILAGVIYKGKSDETARTERINEIAAAFSDPDNLPTDIPLSSGDVQLLLDELLSGGVKDNMARPTYLQALNIGKATDGVDISAQVANYARDVGMTGALRVKLFQVIGARGDESALPALIEFAQTTDDTAAGQGALNAAKQMATTSNFESLLTIITNSANASIKTQLSMF